MLHARRLHRKSLAGVTAFALAAAGSVAALVLPASSTAAATCNGYVALTFDDGPTGSTSSLINALRSAGVRATMFNVGQKARANPAGVQAQKNANMWIGNHSYTHPYLTNLGSAQVSSELSQTQSAITSAGAAAPRVFRPPYGASNSTVTSAASALGLRTVTWSVDSKDWNGASASQIVQAASSLQAGGIMLMHDGYSSTISAIPQIVANLNSRGLCAGMISSSSGTAVAPDGTGTTYPTTTTRPTTTTSGGTGGSTGSCYASYRTSASWSDRYNGTVTVSGNSRWIVTVTLRSPQKVSSTWNAAFSWPSTYVMTAKPNGAGNTFGFTVMKNGSTATPTVSCRVG